jgi:mannose-6-phosphate isomerase-like protein (cupin superfamily)
MSLVNPSFTESEVIGRAPATIHLLADASSTGGALSTQRVTLTGGADGARPHHHANSAELFYLLDGTYFQSSALWNQARALPGHC